MGTTARPSARDDRSEETNTGGKSAGNEGHGKLGVAKEVKALQLLDAGSEAGADKAGREGVGDTLRGNRVADEGDATTRGENAGG